MKATISGIDIKGVLGIVPDNISYFDDEVGNYQSDESSNNKLKKLMGYEKHHVVSSDTCVSDLAVKGFLHLFNTQQFSSNDISGLFLITQTPDYIIPSTSSVLHGALELNESCYCIDINDGCNGYIKGLYEAASYLSNTNNRFAVVVAGDVLSRRVSQKDRNSYPLVGDAVTITLLENTGSTNNISSEIYNSGAGHQALMIPAGGMRLKSSLKTSTPTVDSEGNIRSLDDLVMKGRDVFTFTQTTVVKFLEKFINKHKDYSDYYFLHQANKFILERIATITGLDKSKVPTNIVSEYGNSSSATIPMTICSKFSDSDLSKLNSNVTLCGFGVGLSWGAIATSINSLNFCQIIKYEE